MVRFRMLMILATLVMSLLQPAFILAGEADVVGVKANPGKDGTWSFSVTVKHADEGWDHYAERWDVMGPDGEILGTRVLYHPHVSEQPFTRSLSGVEIPEGVKKVTVRARDSVHGYGGKEVTVKLLDE